MVVKKRCDFCLKIKPDNLQAQQKVLNKDLKDVLINLAGVEVASEQLSNILTCFDCAIALIQAEPIAVKVRTLLTRLSKHKIKRKTSAVNGDVSAGASIQEQSTLAGIDELQDTQDDDKKPVATEKVVARRKSVSAKKTATNAIDNDVLEGSPAASSTRTTTPKKQKALNSSKQLTKPKISQEQSNKSNEEKFEKPTPTEISAERNSQNEGNSVGTKKPTAARKSVVKKLSDSMLNEGLGGSPVASSTMAILDDKLTPKRTPIKEVKPLSIIKSVEGIVSPKKAAKRKISEKFESNSQDEKPNEYIGQKSMKRTISERSDNNSQEDKSESFKASKKTKTAKIGQDSSQKKRTTSDKSDHNNSQDDNNSDSFKPFKKMKDPDAIKIYGSQDSINDGIALHECMECGKMFRVKERYEAHVYTQKCKIAAYACEHPSCLRRFCKLQKMLEHVQKKHPELQRDADTD